MIDHIFKADIIDSDEKNILHQIRVISNKGAHPDENNEEITEEETLKALTDMKNFLQATGNKDEESVFLSTNVPMEDPDYYSVTKRIRSNYVDVKFGWDVLALDPEYVRLYRRAENNDVSAWIELALGFLPKHIVASEDYVIKKIVDKFRDNVPTMYYKLIVAAAYVAMEQENKGEYYDKKYIVPALWDAINFLFYIYNHYDFLNSITKYHELRYDRITTITEDEFGREIKINDMFRDKDIFFSKISKLIDFFESIVKDNPNGKCLAPVYKLTNKKAVEVLKNRIPAAYKE